MNKQQTKILLTKILPRFLIIGIIVIGLIALVVGRFWGEKIKKENDEWFSDPANKAKIERAINKNSTESNSDALKVIRDIKINTFDWKILAYAKTNPIDFPNLHILNGADEILIISMAKKRFDDLSEFSNYEKADFEKSYSKKSPKFIERSYFQYKGQEAFMDVYSLTVNNQKINLGLLNFKYKGNYYHISHYLTTKSRRIIDNINLD